MRRVICSIMNVSLCIAGTLFLDVATVYSWYGACEYLVVFTNILFHTVEWVDVGEEYYLTLAPLTAPRRAD